MVGTGHPLSCIAWTGQAVGLTVKVQPTLGVSHRFFLACFVRLKVSIFER